MRSLPVGAHRREKSPVGEQRRAGKGSCCCPPIIGNASPWRSRRYRHPQGEKTLPDSLVPMMRVSHLRNGLLAPVTWQVFPFPGPKPLQPWCSPPETAPSNGAVPPKAVPIAD